MKSITLLLIIFLSISLNAEIAIKGKILGANGSIQKVAGVEYFSNSDSESKKFAYTDDNGEFELKIMEKGFYELNVLAAYHKPFNFKLINLGEDKEYELVIQLKPYEISQKKKVVEIIGDFNNFSIYENIQAMEKHGDEYKINIPVENGKVRYQILGIPGIPIRESQPGNSLNYEYVPGNGLATVIETDQDSIDIVFDPNKLPKDNNELNIQNVSPQLMKHIMANDKLEDISKKYRNIIMSAIFEKNKKRTDSLYRAYFNELEKLIEKYDEEENKMLFRIEYLKNADVVLEKGNGDYINSSIIKDLFEDNEPDSFIWNYLGYSMYPALNFVYESPMEIEFVKKLLSQEDSDKLKIKFLFDAIRYCYFSEDIENSKKVMDKMLELFPEHDLTLKAKIEFSPYKKIRVGNKLPQFQFENAYSKEKISNDDIKGKITLIDVWASWCGPCILQIPDLRNLYDKYNDKGFEILSVSIDRSKESLKSFQKGRMEMTWLSAWSEGEYKSKVSELFEVNNIPYFILVDRDGKIIAIDQDAHGESLEKILQNEL